jgi:hypothetical protein
MRNKLIINLSFLMLILFTQLSCKREHEGFDAGGPITRHLLGRWQLEKVVGPSGTRIGAQIGYSEIVEIGNDQVDDYEKTFKDGSLTVTHTRVRSPAPVANAKDMTMTMFYFGGQKRFYKVRQDPSKTTLEASAYLNEISSVQDSIRYHYYRIK